MIIEGLLSQSEGKTLEFKRDLSSPKGLMKTLVAFSKHRRRQGNSRYR